jgi:septum formation protein
MKPLIYLASASPRRHELLKQIGVEHEVLDLPSPPGEDEPRLATESPLAYVQRTAQDKASRARQWLAHEKLITRHDTNHIAVLTADTTVAYGDLVLGKPQNKQEAADILRLLSNQTHTVYTALVLSWIRPVPGINETNTKREGIEWHQSDALSKTLVSFGELSESAIQEYIETQEPFGKAGAYGIQGHAAKFIQRIEGSYSGVMGLPLFETTMLLNKMK